MEIFDINRKIANLPRTFSVSDVVEKVDFWYHDFKDDKYRVF